MKDNITEAVTAIRSWNLQWSLENLFLEIIKNAVSLLQVDFGYLLLLEAEGMVIKSQYAQKDKELLPYMPDIAEKVIRHGSAIYASNIYRPNQKESQIYCVPLTANQGVLGVLYLEILDNTTEIELERRLSVDMLGLQAASFLENSILYHSAITDPLTGLYSHRHFQQECDLMLRRAQRSPMLVTLMIIDLDHFKQLNDQFGHEEGNRCLKRISTILKNNFRNTDIIARFGGDEFEVLLPDAPLDKCLQIAETIRQQIYTEPFPSKITATIGIATYPIHAETPLSLFLAADQALYEGKENGRNNVNISANQAHSNTQLNTESVQKFRDTTTNQIYKKENFFETMRRDVQKIDGFDIIGRIAGSSNGEVLKVKQYELDRIVALKRPLASHLSEEQAAAFKKEAFLTASLSHPGIVPLYTIGKGIDGRPYYIMKPIQGHSLEKVLNLIKEKETQTLQEYTVTRLLHILLKISETVAYAHSKNIAHLDIHPGNIIIGDYGEITLIDWGKGIRINEQSTTEASTAGIYISGSPVYRPPEQIVSSIVGSFTDIYSLGAILFEILSGTTPFLKKSMKETIDSITAGIQISDQMQTLQYEVEPLLLNLCKESMQKNKDHRIDITQFIKKLTRFVLLETDVRVHNFLDPKNVTQENDWVDVLGTKSWALNDGVWSSIHNSISNQLFWRIPVTGNFTFTCEGWISEYPRELAIFCFGKSVNDKRGWNNFHEQNRGYCFQFGADDNLYTKLARHGEDVLVNSKKRIELHRKYTITISHQDNSLLYFIDGELIFNYRELHPFIGYHIGFYCYKNGSHFKPIEIKYQTTGLTIPSIRIADENAAANHFNQAITRYDEIMTAFPDKLEGLEATLKKGYCLIKTNNIPEALKTLQHLTGTMLEPYATIETALLELPANAYETTKKNGDYQKALSIIKKTIEKFPDHQAVFRIFPACHCLIDPQFGNTVTFKKNRAEDLTHRAEILKIGLRTLMPPGHTQLACLQGVFDHLALLSQWEELLALATFYTIHFREYLVYGKRVGFGILGYFHAFHKLEYIKSFFTKPIQISKFQVAHIIMTIEELTREELLAYTKVKIDRTNWSPINYKLIILLVLKEKINLNVEFYEPFQGNVTLANQNFMLQMKHQDHFLFEMLLADDLENIQQINHFLEQFSITSQEHQNEANLLRQYYLAVASLINLDPAAAFQHIEQCHPSLSNIPLLQEKIILLTSLLHNLGFQSTIPKEQLLELNRVYLVGHRLELANDFLNKESIILSKKWTPKPMDQFWDYVLYCIWAFLENDYTAVKTALKIVMNESYGNAYFQKFLHKLNKKIKETTNHEN